MRLAVALAAIGRPSAIMVYSLFVMAMRQQRDSDACLRRFSGPATAPPPLPKILARNLMTGGSAEDGERSRYCI